jgi:2',3'-cyclic-nucleotide 2'-phosphodiesterase (5'-nucleotidase family)
MRLSVCLGVTLATACAGARSPSAPSPEGARPPVTLSIFATNDVHGQLERLPVLAGFVNNLKRVRRGGGVLLVDAGDAFQGTIESNLGEGAAVIAAYDAMGYAAMALGNHEFDFGPVGPESIPCHPGEDAQGALQKRLGEARFPVLAANLTGPDGKRPPWRNLAAGTETTVAGVRIGIVGLLTETASDVIKRPNFAGFHVAPLLAAAQAEATRLRQGGADVVVVVAHAGGECRAFDDPSDLSSCDPDSEIFRLARGLPPGLVDVIVGGHRNAAVAHVVAGIPVVHAPSNLVGFSRVDLVFDPAAHRVTSRHVEPPHAVCTQPAPAACTPGDYEGAPVVPDAATEAAIRPALVAASALRDKALGVTVAATFPVRKDGETALGNLFADLMREALPGTDAAFGNAGSVRDVLPEGELTYGRLHHVMPFDNQLARLHVTGAQLRQLVTTNLVQGEHGLLSLSGLGVRARCEGGALDVTLVHPDGAAVRDDEALTVATNDFLALGGDGLTTAIGLPDSSVEIDPGKPVLEALIDGMVKRRTLRPGDPALYDPAHPRLVLPGPVPLRCPPPSR